MLAAEILNMIYAIGGDWEVHGGRKQHSPPKLLNNFQAPTFYFVKKDLSLPKIQSNFCQWIYRMKFPVPYTNSNSNSVGMC